MESEVFSDAYGPVMRTAVKGAYWCDAITGGDAGLVVEEFPEGCNRPQDGGDDCAGVFCSYGGNPYGEIQPCCASSPILIDVAGNGFALTNAANGVIFNLSQDNTTYNWS